MKLCKYVNDTIKKNKNQFLWKTVWIQKQSTRGGMIKEKENNWLNQL